MASLTPVCGCKLWWHDVRGRAVTAARPGSETGHGVEWKTSVGETHPGGCCQHQMCGRVKLRGMQQLRCEWGHGAAPQVVASCLDTLRPVVLEDFYDRADLATCLKASANIPVIAGAPMLHR